MVKLVTSPFHFPVTSPFHFPTKGRNGKRFTAEFDRTMAEIRRETATPGTRLNRLATGQ